MLVFFFHKKVTFVEQRCSGTFPFNLGGNNDGGKSLVLTRNDKYNFHSRTGFLGVPPVKQWASHTSRCLGSWQSSGCCCAFLDKTINFFLSVLDLSSCVRCG